MSGWGRSSGHLPGFSLLPEPGLASGEVSTRSLLVARRCRARDCPLGDGSLPGKTGPTPPLPVTLMLWFLGCPVHLRFRQHSGPRLPVGGAKASHSWACPGQ